MDFQKLSRRQLQALCKKNKIPANQTNVAMAAALAALPTVEGLEEISPGKGLADGGGSACVTATTARRTSRVQIRATPAKVKTLDFTEEMEAIPNHTPAPVPASRRRGASLKGGETAMNSVMGTRRSTRLAAKSASRGSEATAPKKMEFEEIVESFGEISLDEKSEEKLEVALQVEEADLSAEIVDANNVPKAVDETKIDDTVTITVDASTENVVEKRGNFDMPEEVVESKQDAVSQIEAKNDDVLDGADEHVLANKEIQSLENLVEATKEIFGLLNDQIATINSEVDDGAEEQVINEKEVQSIENVQMKESNVESMEDVDVNVIEKAVEEVYVDFSCYQIETNNSEVDVGTEEQVIVEDEKEIPSSDFRPVSENVEKEGSNVEDISNVDESKAQSSDSASKDLSDSESEDESDSDDLTDNVENEGSNVEDMSDVDETQFSDLASMDESDFDSEDDSDDLKKSGDSGTVEKPKVVVALEVPSDTVEVLEDSLAEKLNSIELKDDVVEPFAISEEDNVMEDSTGMEKENKSKEEEGLNNITAMVMDVEKSEAAMPYLSPVKAPVPQLQMSVRKTPTSGKRMTVRFSDDDKENSMIDSIGAKMMMLTSPAKESVLLKESQKPSYKADELSLRKLKKELKAKLAEKAGAARPALQALPENRQVMESN